MSDLPPVPPHIIRATAPLLLGGLWNWCLFGVLVVQFYVYSYNFPRDSKRVKLLVYGVFFLEFVQTVLNGADLFHWFASGYGNIDHLFAPFASPYDGPILQSVVSAIVQFFYAYRIWVLSNKQSRWLCLLICLFSTVNLAAGFTGGIYVHIHQRFASGRPLKSIAITWLVGNAMADILVTSAMVYHVTKLRRSMSCYFADNILVKIVRLTIETNLLTTTVGMVALLVVVVFPNENWYTCPTTILGKLYSNTLLVSLNSRIAIRREDNPRLSTLSTSIAFDITSHPTGSPTNITLKDTGTEAVYKPSDSVTI